MNLKEVHLKKNLHNPDHKIHLSQIDLISCLQLRCVPQKESKDGVGTCSGIMMVIGGAVTVGSVGSVGMPGIVSSTILVKKHCTDI